MAELLTEIRFWAQVIGDAKRTVICSPEIESRAKGWVAARGLSGIITVTANPACPDDRLYVIDTGAVQSYLNRPFQFLRPPAPAGRDDGGAE